MLSWIRFCGCLCTRDTSAVNCFSRDIRLAFRSDRMAHIFRFPFCSWLFLGLGSCFVCLWLRCLSIKNGLEAERMGCAFRDEFMAKITGIWGIFDENGWLDGPLSQLCKCISEAFVCVSVYLSVHFICLCVCLFSWFILFMCLFIVCYLCVYVCLFYWFNVFMCLLILFIGLMCLYVCLFCLFQCVCVCLFVCLFCV